MSTIVPAGFCLLEPTSGYGEGFGPIWVDRSRCAIGFRVEERHVNPRGVCHGGALSMFADYQITAVIAEGVPLVEAPITISLSIDYLGPAALGSWVEAEVQKLRETRTLTFTQAVIQANGDAVARCNGVYRNYVRRTV